MNLQDALLSFIPTPRIDVDLFEFGFGSERFIFSERYEAEGGDLPELQKTISACVQKIMKDVESTARERKAMPRFVRLESPAGMRAVFSGDGAFRIMNAFDINTGKTFYAVDALVEM